MSMATVEELQKHLEVYVAEVAQGHEVLISRDDRPVARLAPIEESAWYSISAPGLARAYSDAEPDYSADMLKEAHPQYQP